MGRSSPVTEPVLVSAFEITKGLEDEFSQFAICPSGWACRVFELRGRCGFLVDRRVGVL